MSEHDPTAPKDSDPACDECGERAVMVVHDDDGTEHPRCAHHPGDSMDSILVAHAHRTGAAGAEVVVLGEEG